MHEHRNHSNHSGTSAPFWKSGSGAALIMLALIAGFYLLREHWSHLGQSWPYLLLCPLMHIFLHGGHRHGHGNSGHSMQSRKPYWKDEGSNS